MELVAHVRVASRDPLVELDSEPRLRGRDHVAVLPEDRPPQDLGMDWIVSKTKRDFVGLRSFSRTDTARGDRTQLVGLLPEQRLDEGAQLVPGPGHVTSSYQSAALGRPFALALLARGRERIGETVQADGVPAEVVESVLYDREGARRDGRPA